MPKKQREYSLYHRGPGQRIWRRVVRPETDEPMPAFPKPLAVKAYGNFLLATVFNPGKVEAHFGHEGRHTYEIRPV